MLSPRRFGVTVRANREWQHARESGHAMNIDRDPPPRRDLTDCCAFLALPQDESNLRLRKP
jgi:hypothetical protein